MVIGRLSGMLRDGVRVFFIMGIGDVIAQTVIDKKPLRNLDIERTARFATVGLICVGPVLNVWYGALEKIVSKDQPPVTRGIKKVALDQLCFSPFFTAALISVIASVNGETCDQIKKRLQNDYITVLKNSYLLWPAAQMINFCLVPMQYQVSFAQVIAVIWNCYLSLVLN